MNGLEKEYGELKVKREILVNEFKGNRAAKYIPMITAKGKLKGELAHLTTKQFRDFTGVEPRQSIIIKGKIPWHLALDTIATEAGYKSDEALREAVLDAKETKTEIDKLSHDIKIAGEQIVKSGKKLPKIESVKMEGNAPVFPKEETTTEVLTEVNGMVMKRRRNPSFWQVETDKDGDNKPDIVVRVRYAGQAKQLVHEAAKGHQADIVEDRQVVIRTIKDKPTRTRTKQLKIPKELKGGGGLEFKGSRGHIKL